MDAERVTCPVCNGAGDIDVIPEEEETMNTQLLLSLTHAAKHYRAALAEEQRAEETMLKIGARGLTYSYAYADHRAAVQQVETAQSALVRAALALTDAITTDDILGETQPMPAVEE